MVKSGKCGGFAAVKSEKWRVASRAGSVKKMRCERWVSDLRAQNYVEMREVSFRPQSSELRTMLRCEIRDVSHKKNETNNILRAHDGMEAIRAIRKHDFDLVLMDIKMPVMNGLEATKLIKQLQPQLPIIAQTGFSQPEEAEQAIAAGCSAFIPKPIIKNELFKVINSCYVMKE